MVENPMRHGRVRDTRRRSWRRPPTAWPCWVALGVLAACSSTGPLPEESRRLSARPGTPTVEATLGETPLGLESGRDGLLFVPQGYEVGVPLPLLVFLHGATGSAEGARFFGELADSLEAVVLIPESRAITWDAIRGRFGPDVDFLDRALEHVFDRVEVDASRIALAGFSDGATYALSLGVSNGDLFSHLIAFSPGGIDRREAIGSPAVFVTHGTGDRILPVGASRDTVVPLLESTGYEVVYREFDGGHVILASLALEALDWFLG